jgi:hypothetical protein
MAQDDVAFVKHLKEALEELRDQLAPLESGSMHLGRRSMGGMWEDVTTREIALLKRSIAKLEALIKQHGG